MHTPGPWVADQLLDRSEYNIFMPGYCSAGASVHHCSSASTCMGSLVVEANARLIAAAPDLLAALQLCLKYLNGGSDLYPGLHHEAYTAARAAIAKTQA